MLTIGSVCSGAGTAELIARDIGVSHAWCSEVELSACAVLSHRFGASAPEHPPYWLDAKKTAAWHKGVTQMNWGTDLRNIGDMTVLPDLIREGKVEAPDIFTGGTPCVAFSVAGKRRGLEDLRGNLTLTFTEICNAIDDARQAVGKMGCGIVWENVPGVLSDPRGQMGNPFGCFLSALAGYEAAVVAPGGKFNGSGVVVGPRRRVAWCVLDAQFMGVPQRRRRVFVVATPVDAVSEQCLGGLRPEVMLALGNCMRRDTPTRRGTGQDASSAAGSAAAEDCIPIDTMNHIARGPEHWRDFTPGDPSYTLSKGHSHAVAIPPQTQYGDIAGALTARHNSSPCADRGMNVVAFAQNQCGELRTSDVANTLGTNSNASGRNTPMVAQEPIAFGWQEARNFRALDDGYTNTLTKNQTKAVAISLAPDTANAEMGHDIACTLKVGGATQMVGVGVDSFRESGPGYWMEDSISGTLRAEGENRPSRPSNVIAQGIDKASSSPFSDLSPTIKTDLGQGMGPCVADGGCWWDGGQVSQTLDAVLAKGQTMPEKNRFPAAIDGGGVLRRLMPMEAERLMGWPEEEKSYTFVVWKRESESQEPDAPAEINSPKNQSSALTAEDAESSEPAQSAEEHSANARESHGNVARLNVRLSYDSAEVRLHSGNFQKSLALTAENSSIPALIDVKTLFALLPASILTTRESEVEAGKGGEQPNGKLSLRLPSGETCVRLSGLGINVNANDAVLNGSMVPAFTKCITSGLTQNSPQCDLILRTLFSSVYHAIGSYIPEEMWAGNSLEIKLSFGTGWTLVPFQKGRLMTDGHRYKICGNGWAYPVARWVIEGLKEAME